MHRTSKRARSSNATIRHHHHVSKTAGIDSRHKRVRKACERCRMKKTKCDGEFPCKRCKDDGSVCTAAIRRKMEYKQLPQGYAEVLENTQLALIATVHKLYSMVLNNHPWGLGEPELNGCGQPVIHNIAQKLGCIQPNSDIDLPVHSVFPEDEAGMAELARQLEGQKKENEQQETAKDADSSVGNRIEQVSSSEFDHSDFEYDYRKPAFGDNAMILSSQSFAGSSSDCDFAPLPPDIDAAAMFPSQSPLMPNFPAWPMGAKPQPSDLTMQFLQQPGVMGNTDLLYQGLVESDFGPIKPHVLSCPNPEVTMGMGDPMIYSGYDGEPMRL
ncbi:Fluconazole resistance protein 1 [Fusarium solani]